MTIVIATMYIPPANQVHDPDTIADFIDAHGFATVVSAPGGVPCASHLPVLHDRDSRTLRSHMARANGQWRHFTPGAEVLCIFHGPHSYIRPSWYAAPGAVPTWNYAVAHVHGVAELVEEPGELRRIVADTVEKYESRYDCPWPMDLPDETMAGLLRAIVGFSIRITRIEAKFKLGQNRSAEDQTGMLAGLAADPSHDANALAEFVMRVRG